MCNESVKRKNNNEKIKSIKRYIFLKKAPESLKKYKKQKNSCSRLCKKAHKKCFTNLDLSKIYGNKTF